MHIDIEHEHHTLFGGLGSGGTHLTRGILTPLWSEVGPFCTNFEVMEKLNIHISMHIRIFFLHSWRN
jgi:tRNA A37 threonylcarbamoyladenosine biosynthesis protein TsaE